MMLAGQPVLKGSRKLLIVATVLCAACSTLAAGSFSSSIYGVVYDDRRNPVVDVDVELLNENYVQRQRTRTNGIGKYQFNNLSDGRYYVRVLPFRYNLNDQILEVKIDTLSILGTNAAVYTQDFFLTRKKGANQRLKTGVVFAQEIPAEAERFYTRGVDAFGRKDSKKGISRMLQAIDEFPDYFAAHQMLGIELMRLNRYKASVYYFNRAAEINPKSVGSLYNLGLAFHKLGKKFNDAALVAFKRARALSPGMYTIALQMGRIERQQGNFKAAEKLLLKAKDLAPALDPEVHIELAQLYGNDLKQYGKAADELELYLKASRKNDKKTKQMIEDLRKKAVKSS